MDECRGKSSRRSTILIEKEEVAQERFCNYMKILHPDLIFYSDGSGLKLTKGLAIKFSKLKSSRAIPDMFISESIDGYHGLFIELKREGTRIFKKNGGYTTEHIAEQAEMLGRLNKKGYYACFCIGYDECIDTLNNYLNEKK